jgi:hypothetical protein
MTDYIILMPLSIILFGLTPIVLRDSYLGKSKKQVMIGIITLISLNVVQNVAEYILQTAIVFPYLRTVISTFGYCIRPVIIVLFCKLVKPNVKNTVAWILVIINALVYSTALYSKWVFFIDENNHYQGGRLLEGKLSNLAYYICGALLCHLLYCTIIEFKNRKSWLWMVVVNAALVVFSMLLELSPASFDYPVDYVTIASVCCSLFYYIWLHLEFVKDHEMALMAEQRIKIMMSQIQPHFLYNTLASIQSLCLTDPIKAAEVTGKFGVYLRNNLDSLETPTLIPVEKELEHTRVYAEIEMMRFPKIEVKYNIEAKDFYIPALTIQPLVENSIRHGLRKREHGVVEISTRKIGDSYRIVISDNGIGFDPEEPLSTEKSHIGLSNVRERIEEMCSGTLTIDSHPNKGTVISIDIPEETK